MKKIYLPIMFLLILVLAACGSSEENTTQSSSSSSSTSSTSTTGVLNLKSADVVAGDSPYTWGMEELSSKLEERTDGQIKIQHFPAGQLGNDSQIVEGVKLGSIDIGMVGTIQSKVTEALYLPYLFSDVEHMHAVLDGEIGEQLKQRFEEETGIKMIGFVYYPSRVLTTKGKEITEVSQLKGLKVRVPEMPPMVATWEALGATPTPIAFTELFSALQSGVVDAQENPYEIIVNNSFYEVQDTVIETHHALPVRFLIMNKKRYESLSDEQKEILDSSWKETSLAIEKLYLEKEEEYKQKLIDEGMKFITPNMEDFEKATSEVWKDFADDAFGEGVYQKIQELKNK